MANPVTVLDPTRRAVTLQYLKVGYTGFHSEKNPNMLNHRSISAFLAGTALLLALNPAWSKIEYTENQAKTAEELVEQLESRHYSKMKYDDELSSQHLDNYIDSLDRGKMFFLAADLESFEPFRRSLDDQLADGNLKGGFEIFEVFRQRLETRLEQVIDTLPEMMSAMDFEIDETLDLDPEQRAWAIEQAQLDERWRKQLKNQVLSLRMADKKTEDIPETLQKRYRNQLKRVRQYNSQDVFQVYANALTELYDPHTNYFSPARSENFNINMSLSLEGIGAVLQLEDDYTKVSRLVAAGPADKHGGIEPNDKIIAVGQGDGGEMEDVIGWRLDEVVQLIRGPKDSKVRLEIIPAKSKSEDNRKIITIVRNKVKLEEQSAQKDILEIPDGDSVRKVGVIDIPAFYIDFEAMRRGDEDYKSTTRDVKKLLDELVAEDVDGIVIDLRNNGGGSLQEANELTGLFIEYGPTVQIRHSSRRVWRDGKRLRGDYYDGPLVVLINRLSASASEIFAGAIQDYQRGIVVGDQSFGKGTVQSLIPLTEGQLKLTESKFYRISGDSTQHRGVIPDVGFPALYDADEIGESSLDHALPWDQINPVRHRRYHELEPLMPRLTDLFNERSATDPDFIYLQDQLALATENREIVTVPLNEEARRELREAQDAKVLTIENKRRIAKGLEPLSSLDEDEEEVDEVDGKERANDPSPGSRATVSGADEAVSTHEPVLAETSESSDDDSESTEEDRDVLLVEAGHVLIDAQAMRARRFAVNEREVESP